MQAPPYPVLRGPIVISFLLSLAVSPLLCPSGGVAAELVRGGVVRWSVAVAREGAGEADRRSEGIGGRRGRKGYWVRAPLLGLLGVRAPPHFDIY